jgi:hypothetical protein
MKLKREYISEKRNFLPQIKMSKVFTQKVRTEKKKKREEKKFT